MGCADSKADHSPLVTLCRERRELIRGAEKHRVALAAAHEAYFRSLGRVGDALQRFVEEELVDAEAEADPGSPVLTLPPSDGGGKGKGTANSKVEKYFDDVAAGSNAGDDGDAADSSPSLTANSCLHSDDSHLHLPSDSESEEIDEESSAFEANAAVISSDSTRSFPHPTICCSHPPLVGGQAPFYGIQQPFYGYQPPFYSGQPPSYVGQPFYSGPPIPSLHYMKSSSTETPTMYQNPYPQLYNSATQTAYEYGYPVYGVQMDLPQANPAQDESFLRNVLHREEMATDPAPSPPEPEVSSWDFLNPFNSYEDLIPGYLQNRYDEGSSTSSPNSIEIRAKEGIPDLEEETEQESMKGSMKEKMVVDEGFTKRESGAKMPKEETKILKAETKREEKENKEKHTSSGEEKEMPERGHNVNKLGSGEEERSSMKRNVTLEVETSVVTEDTGLRKFTTLSAHGTRDITEVVKEIKEQFRSVASSASEVSKILEVGKIHYRSRNNFRRVISKRILDSLLLPTLVLSRVPRRNPQHSASSSLKTRKAERVSRNYVNKDAGNLSTTLQKLYAWEKKLYKEVKEEEKLRAAYDRQWRQLKALDNSGAEASKIDDSQVSVRKLLTKLNITIKSVDYISRRIHKVRDEELQPRLVDLLQGLVKMWKSVLECHHKQFQAVHESKSQSFRVKTGSSVTKITTELEKELLDWCSCFSNWIQSQRTYIGSVNGWLMKWLIEKEETPDGVARFSPSRIGAPAAFVISNDWYHTIDRMSPDGVIKSMQAFAINIHQLWEMQDEEQHQKLKAEYLSKDFSKRFGSLQKKNGMHVHQDVFDKVKLSASENDLALHDDHMIALDAMKKRLDEERAKHLEAIKRVQEFTASDLRTGLIPIFQALEDFSSDTLKAYEGVRVLNGSAESLG